MFILMVKIILSLIKRKKQALNQEILTVWGSAIDWKNAEFKKFINSDS